MTDEGNRGSSNVSSELSNRPDLRALPAGHGCHRGPRPRWSRTRGSRHRWRTRPAIRPRRTRQHTQCTAADGRTPRRCSTGGRRSMARAGRGGEHTRAGRPSGQGDRMRACPEHLSLQQRRYRPHSARRRERPGRLPVKRTGALHRLRRDATSRSSARSLVADHWIAATARWLDVPLVAQTYEVAVGAAGNSRPELQPPGSPALLVVELSRRHRNNVHLR